MKWNQRCASSKRWFCSAGRRSGAECGRTAPSCRSRTRRPVKVDFVDGGVFLHAGIGFVAIEGLRVVRSGSRATAAPAMLSRSRGLHEVAGERMLKRNETCIRASSRMSAAEFATGLPAQIDRASSGRSAGLPGPARERSEAPPRVEDCVTRPWPSGDAGMAAGNSPLVQTSRGSRHPVAEIRPHRFARRAGRRHHQGAFVVHEEERTVALELHILVRRQEANVEGVRQTPRCRSCSPSSSDGSPAVEAGSLMSLDVHVAARSFGQTGKVPSKERRAPTPVCSNHM